MKYLLILLFLFSTHSFSEESLNKYTINANGNVEIIEVHKYSKTHSFKNYKITRIFEDNLGNYGFNSAAVIAEYKEGNVINLKWTSKLTYQNNGVIFAQCIRKKGVDETGAGKAILFSGEKPLVMENLLFIYAHSLKKVIMKSI
jgi:hypothetical protein